MKSLLLKGTFIAFIVLIAVAFGFAGAAWAKSKTPEIKIQAKKYAFDPAEITLHMGETTKLVFVSDDVEHSIAVDGLGIDADIRKHHSTVVFVTPKETGDFQGRCTVYCGVGHDAMKLVIHVVQ
jgi:cytochrome c oxidase subunit 2